MSDYGCQLKALVKRNFLLKRYALPTTLMEIFLPILMVIISYIVNNISKTISYPAVEPTPAFDITYAFKYSTLRFGYQSTPTIGYILPKNNKDETIINKIKGNEMFQNSRFQFINFENQDKMSEFNNNYHNLLVAGIIFESDDYMHYTIRVNSTVAPDPSQKVMMDYSLGRYSAEEYGGTEADLYMSIFSPIQGAIDEAIIQLKTNDDTFSMHHEIGKLGRAACNGRQTDNGGNLGYFVSNIFTIPIVVIVIFIVKEREDGIKDGLLMSGVHPTIFWLSWLIVYITFSAFITAFVTLIFFLTKTFANVQPFLFFLSVFLYGLSCCSLAFICSTFFKKSKTAGTTTTVIIVFLTCSNMLTPYIKLIIRKILSPILCPITIGSLINEIDGMEDRFENLTFKNLFKNNAGYFFLVLIFNNIVYFLLAIILDNLLSNEGSRYLSFFNKKIKLTDNIDSKKYEQDIQEDFNEKNGEKCIVEVSHVHKLFPKKKDEKDAKKKGSFIKKMNKKDEKFLAVNDISFKVYQNEIFAILGHNGAGKTTLINIMVGLLNASKGDVYFDGKSIAKNTNDIRKDFGVCAQYNTIFNELSVEEHIKFYAELKNITVDVDEVLSEIDLLHQKKMKAAKLSGGQKRKLCIGMAILGNPKYVFLDEPTTGLDPLSRRKIWDLLIKKKEGRVIFLTTHYMDEADILADRKVIISKGKIRCLGTSLYLKNHFNMSYNLDIETNDKDQVDSIIRNHLPEATYTDVQSENVNHNNEENKKENEIQCHTWKLPINVTDKFTPLLNELDELVDDSQRQGLVKKYALNMPTLEELFIHLEDQIYEENNNNNNNNSDIADSSQVIINTNDTEIPKLKDVEKPSSFKQILYLIKSRLKIFVKDKGFAFSSIILPGLINGIMFVVIQKVFITNNNSTKTNVISIPTMYNNNTYFNLEPQSELHFTQEDWNAVLGDSTAANIITHLSLKDIPNPEAEDTYYLSSVNGQEINNNYRFQIHYNETMLHSIPATLNALSNTILASKNIDERIVLTSHLYETNAHDVKTMVGLSISGFMIGYCIVANINKFGPLIVRERELQLLKQLQLNGVSRLHYWISCLVTDIFLFLFSCCLIFIIGVIVQFEMLMEFKILVIIFILLLIWSLPTMLYQYVIGFFFETEESAFSGISIMNTYPVIFGYLVFIIIDKDYYIFDGIIGGKGLIGLFPNIYNICLTIVFPAYGFIAMVNSLFTMKLYQKLIHYDVNLSHILQLNNGISPIIITMVVLTVLLFIILVHLDKRKNQTNKKDIYDTPSSVLDKHMKALDEGDDDVRSEYEYVKEHQNDLSLSVLHLSKEYKTALPKDKEEKKKIVNKDPLDYTYGDIHKSPITGKYVKTAVIDVSFGVRNHECFGLLGPNGAGKSTTLNVITSTMPQTTGKVCFSGVDSHLIRLGEISMGYCPQNDILWKELTLREHLELFLRIRGYTKVDALEYASQYIRALGLEEHQNKRVDDLSGGTKRKLSLLIAICGYPKQILLDEPSAGMDPSTRRSVWEIIKKTKNVNDSAIIMTTHSMEEAENLCDRLAILVKGHLTCIGSPEHLKMKFGDNYILELQSSDINHFHQEIIEKERLFDTKEYTMEKSSIDRVKYKVQMTRHLGHIFEVMESCKKRGLVTDYSFNQTTLEQIFINFSKQ